MSSTENTMIKHTLEISIRPAEERDAAQIFSWRNHPETRKHFFNTDLVTWEEHQSWFLKRLADPETSQYIALWGKIDIGTVRFQEEPTVIQCSVMMAPSHIGKGLGSAVIAQGVCRYVTEKRPRKPIIAEVKTGNARSMKAFSRAGFQESHITLVFQQGNPVDCEAREEKER